MKYAFKAGTLAILMWLSACSAVSPGPNPIVEPPVVQEACMVAEWAVPAIQPLLPKLPTQVAAALAIVQGALPSCAAGNATAAIADAVGALVAYLTQQGVQPPPAIAVRAAHLRR